MFHRDARAPIGVWVACKVVRPTTTWPIGGGGAGVRAGAGGARTGAAVEVRGGGGAVSGVRPGGRSRVCEWGCLSGVIAIMHALHVC